MQVFRELREIPDHYTRSVVSVGNFDGVHRAHCKVIGEMVRAAKEVNGKSVVVSFEPHPVRVLRPEAGLKLLTPTPEKLRLLEQTGADATLLLPFNRELSEMTPRQFAERVLEQGLRAAEVHEGDNFRFGHRASGDMGTLVELGRELGFTVTAHPEMRLRGEPVSSSRIRKLLGEGNVSRARHLLGRPFAILSAAAKGRGYGTKYTVPTINLEQYTEIVPANGVYVTRTRVGEEWFESVTNVGNRPTFGEDSFAIESHLLDFHPLELTETTEVELEFRQWLRGEIKFASVESLRGQIGKDVLKAQRYHHLARLAASSSLPASEPLRS